MLFLLWREGVLITGGGGGLNFCAFVFIEVKDYYFLYINLYDSIGNFF